MPGLKLQQRPPDLLLQQEDMSMLIQQRSRGGSSEDDYAPSNNEPVGHVKRQKRLAEKNRCRHLLTAPACCKGPFNGLINCAPLFVGA